MKLVTEYMARIVHKKLMGVVAHEEQLEDLENALDWLRTRNVRILSEREFENFLGMFPNMRIRKSTFIKHCSY